MFLMAGITNLPTELVEIIVSYLSFEDLLSVRLVCRHVHYQSLRYTSSILFRVVSIDFTRDSLTKLQSLSNLPYIARCIRLLRIKDKENPHTGWGYYGSGFNWSREPSGCLEPTTNTAIEMFDSSIRHLTNCKSIHFYPSDSDYIPRHQHQDSISSSDCLFIIFSAFARNSRQLTSFHISPIPSRPPLVRGPLRNGLGLSINPQHLPFKFLRSPEFQNCWKGIQDLTLDLEESSSQEPYELTNLLLRPIQKLRSLILGSDLNDDTLDLLASGNSCGYLTHLDLHGIKASKTPLLKLLASCGKTLTSLKLFDIGSRGSESWIHVLLEIPVLLPSLRCLRLIRLFDYAGGQRRWIVFPNLAGGSVLPGVHDMDFTLYMGRVLAWYVMGVTYSGLEMSKAFDFVVRSAQIL